MPDPTLPRDPDPGDPGDDVRRIEELLGELGPEDLVFDHPPEDVWDGIVTELAAPQPATGPDTGSEPEADGPRLAEVVSLDSRRRFTPARWVGAAAAVVVVVAGVVAISVRGGNSRDVVANAELAFDAATFDELGADAEARVSLVEEGGTFRIEIDEADLPTPTEEPADLELWLIEPDAEGNVADLVSLGVLDPDDPTSFQVPADYDPDVYFVVDISVEPRDGDATHSGRSILRGPLQQT